MNDAAHTVSRTSRGCTTSTDRTTQSIETEADRQPDMEAACEASLEHEAELPAKHERERKSCALPIEPTVPPRTGTSFTHTRVSSRRSLNRCGPRPSFRIRRTARPDSDPDRRSIELRNGKKVTSKRLLYPGYVLVEMEMDDELWHAVKIDSASHWICRWRNEAGSLTADEVNSVLYRQALGAERPRPKMTFEKNETVKIIDGPFTNFSGKVDEVNTERNTLRVHGDDFRPLHAGGTGFPAGRKDIALAN